MFQIIFDSRLHPPPLLVPCKFFFISLNITFTFSCFFSMLLKYQWVPSASWSPVFWTLHLIGWLSPFHLVLFLGFCSVLSSGPYFFVSSIWQPPCVSSMAYCRKVPRLVGWGRALGNLQGQENCCCSVTFCSGGLRNGTVPLSGIWCFVQQKAVSCTCPDTSHFNFSPYATGALQAVAIVLKPRGSESL